MADIFEGVQKWLEIPCEPEDLFAVQQIPHPVYSVGMCLGLDHAEIYGIDHNYREHYEKTLQLLLRWRSRHGRDGATWSKLIECLRKLEDQQLLEDMGRVVQERLAATLITQGGCRWRLDVASRVRDLTQYVRVYKL